MKRVGHAVRIEMLGRFRVLVGEHVITETAWPTRRARELVELLSVSIGQRLPRDQVIEHLWPHINAERGAANLRKAAHYARQALGRRDAVVLRSGRVELFPDHDLIVDVACFLEAADAALRGSDPDRCAAAAALCTGELLPDAPYEAWTQNPRRQVHDRLAALLRCSKQWERLAELDPTDEQACRALMREAMRQGHRHVAIRRYERLRVAMLRELGARPDGETQSLYGECISGGLASEPVFLGRDLAMAEAVGHLHSVAAGRTSALVVRGPSGIGKSAFCRELARRACDAGWRVIDVTATRPARPYAALVAALEPLDSAALAQISPRSRSVIAELTGLAPPAAPRAKAITRHQVVAAVQRVLEADMSSPTLLCIDDAHLLDQASADALHQLVQSSTGPLLVVLACRAEWIRTSLPRGVVELARSYRAFSLHLGPLDADVVADVVARATPLPRTDADIERIVALAEGNPFFALELAHASGTGASQTIRQAVMGRLAELGASTIDCLARLSIAGDELELGDVRALTGLSEPESFSLLDAALDVGVLVVSDAHYRFRHEFVRQTLIDELPSHRRLQLHRDAARHLASAGGPPEAIAGHWLKGRRPVEAVGWLMAATRRATEVGAFADALGHVERLLREAPDHEHGLCARADILDALGDRRAPEAYAAAAAVVGGPEAQDLRARQALAELKASKPDAALRTLRGITPTSTRGRLAEALTLSAAAAIGRYANTEAAAAKADEAYELAIELGEPGAILDATWAHALAAHANGELPARLREYLHATHELPELATHVFDGQLCVTERMLYGGLPNDEIITFADSLAREARRLGAVRGHAFALTLRGEAEILAGRLDAADADFAEGERLHGQIGAVAGEALSLLGRAQVATHRHEPQRAAPLLTSALLMARESEVGHHTLDRIYGAMVAAATCPDHGIATVREAERAIQGPFETCPTCRIAFVVPATIAAARARDLERAHRYAEDCRRAVQTIALPPAWHAAVDEADGWLARATARPDEARRHFQTAATGFRTWGQPLDARRCAELASH